MYVYMISVLPVIAGVFTLGVVGVDLVISALCNTRTGQWLQWMVRENIGWLV